MPESSDNNVCDKCETVYSADRDNCPDCGSSMKRPDFILDSAYIRASPPMSVHVKEGYNDDDPRAFQITMMNPGGDEITWPSVTLKNPELYQKLLRGFQELYSETRWDERSELLEDLSEDHEDTDKVRDLLEQYPSFFNEVLDEVDFENMREEDIGFLTDSIRNLNETVLQAEGEIQQSFLDLLGQLSEEDDTAYEELASLFEEWNALQVTSTTNVLMRRLQFLQTFDDMIHNDDVYEIRGDQSVHRSLESNLWLLDENYWLMQSDGSLRSFIQEEFEEEMADGDEEYARRRPDFVCATHRGELVIAEIKRPSHELQREDVQQLETYLIFANNYSGDDYEPIHGYLVGRTANEMAESAAENNNRIEILTYNDILTEARHRYREYLDELDRADAPDIPSTFDPGEI